MDPMLAEPFSVMVIGKAATPRGSVDMHEVLIWARLVRELDARLLLKLW